MNSYPSVIHCAQYKHHELRPSPNILLLLCESQMNLAWEWHMTKKTAVVSNIEFNSVAPKIEKNVLCFAEDYFKC